MFVHELGGQGRCRDVRSSDGWIFTPQELPKPFEESPCVVAELNRFLNVLIRHRSFYKRLNELPKLSIRRLHKRGSRFRLYDMGVGDEEAFLLESCKPNPDIERFTHMDATAARHDQV